MAILATPTVFLAHPYFFQTTWGGGISDLEGDPGLILKPLHLPPRAWLWLLAFPGTRAGKGKQALTIVASPVDVDASAVVAGKLSQGEAGGIGCQRERPAEQVLKITPHRSTSRWVHGPHHDPQLPTQPGVGGRAKQGGLGLKLPILAYPH